MNRDIINYFKHQYEDEPSLKNKHNYANELSNSHNKKDIIKAIELLKEIQECSDFDLNHKIGNLYRKIGDLENAFIFFDQSKEKTIDEINYEKGKAYLWYKKYDEALEMFDEVYDINLESNVIVQKLKCFIGLDNEKEVLAYFSKGIDFKDIKDKCYKLVGSYYYDKKESSKAYQYYKNIKEEALEYIILFRLGNISFFASNYEEALGYYLKACELNKGNKAQFLTYKIGLSYECLGNYEEAIDYYKRTISISNDMHSYLKVGKLEQKLYETKGMEENTKHIDNAKRYLQKGAELYPDDVFIKYELIKVYMSLSDLTSALRCANEILEKTKDRFTMIQLTRIYFLQGKYDLNIDICKELLDEQEDHLIRITLGRSYFEKGMYREALIELDRVLREKDDYYAMIEKAKVYLHLGNKEKTREILFKIPDDANTSIICDKLNLLSCAGDFEYAYDEMTKLLEKYPDDGKLNITMSNILENNDFIIMAIDFNLRALKCKKRSNYLSHLAGLYHANKEYDKAIQTYLEFMHTGDNYVDGAIGLMKTYMAAKKYEQAYNLAYQMLNSYKHDQALAIMAEIEILMGHYDIANNYYHEIVDQNQNREDSNYVKRLKSLLNN